VAAVTEKDLSLPLTRTSSPPQFAPLEESRYLIKSRKLEKRGKGKSAGISLPNGKRREGKKIGTKKKEEEEKSV
jgi:hypothetical protein